MRAIDKFDILHSLLLRLSRVVMWLGFALFHLTLLALFLAAAWFWKISPEGLEEAATGFFQRLHGPSLLAVAGFLGASGGLAIWWYVRLWKWAYRALVIPFLFAEINEAFRAPPPR